jgi:hypothetical protein
MGEAENPFDDQEGMLTFRLDFRFGSENWHRLFGQRPADFKWIPAGLR